MLKPLKNITVLPLFKTQTILRSCFVSLIVLSALKSSFALAQSTVELNLNGLAEGDIAHASLQLNVEDLKEQTVTGDGNVLTLTFELTSGEWIVGVDVPGYAVNGPWSVDGDIGGSIDVNMSPLDGGDDFSFSWSDDESYGGYAYEFVPGVQPVIEVLDTLLPMPDDFSARQLYREYGIFLDDSNVPWTPEDAYKLWQSLKELPFPQTSLWDEAVLRSVWTKHDGLIDQDVTISTIDGLDFVSLSAAAFTFASPLVVNFDGVEGRYFSRRLHKALLNIVSDFGINASVMAQVAANRYGLTFLQPGTELESLMSETASNFQDFEPWEKVEICAMMEEYPSGMHKQEGLTYLVRRIEGQQNPYYPMAPAIAWVGMEAIEFMGSAFNATDLNYIHRLVLHEKAHFLWEFTFSDELKADWIELGEWFEDPDSESGWSTVQTTEFASSYAHAVNPNEDMAESISYYIENSQVLLTHAPAKYDFIRDRVLHGARYVASIPEELTFEVFNLFPDYVYPGKVVGTEVTCAGSPEDDKTLTFRIQLYSENVELDGASGAFARFTSPVGTYLDMYLSPENGAVDSVLVGTRTVSKHAAAGWWNLNTVDITDPVGNERFENPNTLGCALYVNNPLEDLIPPTYVDDSYSLSLSNISQTNPVTGENEMPALRVKFDTYDQSPLSRGLSRVTFPATPEGNQRTIDIQSNSFPNNGYDEVKHHDMNLPIPHFYPTGEYTVNWAIADDIAMNTSSIYLTEDVANSNANGFNIFAEQRQMIYIETIYPDVLPPMVDLNSIDISASPTQPDSPNGETLVTIECMLQDTSDFDAYAAGLKHVTYTLRNPLGEEFTFTAWDDLGGANYYYSTFAPEPSNEWKTVTIERVLPVGSAAGTWGLSHLQMMDRAHNIKNHSFVEYMHFELDDGSICESDMDADQIIGVNDLLILIGIFGCESECGKPDIDGDGFVAIQDLMVFLSSYGDECP
jgi:hypothetical protein